MIRLHVFLLILSLAVTIKCQKENDDYRDLFYGNEYDASDYDMFVYDDNFTEEIRLALSSDTISTRRLVMSSIYIVITVVGLTLNIISLFTSQKCHDLQYSQRLFMQNLALACIIMLLNLIFSTQYRILDEWRLGRVMCKLTNCLKSFSIYGQAYFSTVLCMDYVVLRKRPGISNAVRTAGEVGTVMLGWMLALGLSLPMVIFSGIDNAIEEKPLCSVLNFGSPDVPFDQSSLYDYLNYEDQNATEFVYSGCKEAENNSFRNWIIAVFVFTFAFPLVFSVISLLLYKFITSPHKVLLRKNDVSVKSQTSTTKSVSSTMAKRFVAAGLWVTFIPLTYLITWLPFHVYHLGRIRGFDITATACMNFEDYCFVQGFLSCVLLPALTIAYSRPRGEVDTHRGERSSRGLTASSTASFTSAVSSNSNRKSTSLASQSAGAGVINEEEGASKNEEKNETSALVGDQSNPCTSML